MMNFTKGMFTIDPNATPEQLKRKRDVIAGITANLGNARYVGQGIGQLGQGIVAGLQNRKMNKIEGQNQSAASSLFDSLFSGGQGGGAGYGGGSYTPAAPPSQFNLGQDETPEQRAAREANSGGTWNGGEISDMQPNMFSTFGNESPVGGKSGYDMGSDAPADQFGFGAVEQQYGLPAGYLGAVGTVESGLNPNAQNPNSSAGGMFQFIDSTAQQYGLTNKMDPAASTEAAARLAADNKKYLTGVLGREPTAGELYLAHQQGAGNAAKLLANPNAPADQVLGGEAFRLNGGRPGMTAADFSGQWTSKVDNLTPRFGGSNAPQVDPMLFGNMQNQPDQPQMAANTGFGFGGGAGGQSGPSTAELMKALGNPWLTPEQRSVLATQLEQAQQQQDPMYQMQLKEQELKLAEMQGGNQTPKALQEREALAAAGGLQRGTPEWNEYVLSGKAPGATGSGTEYGLTPQYGTDKDGNLVAIQFAKDGTSIATPLPEGVALTRGIEKMDLGDSFQFVNTMTGEKIGNPIKKNLGGAAAETAAGKALGEDRALYESIDSKMPGLEKVIGELDALAEKATYTMAGNALDFTRKELGMEPREGAVARAEYIAKVDNQILPMLRDTFGAAFTVKEGDALRATLGDPNSTPAEKKAALRASIEQSRRNLEALAKRTGQAPDAAQSGQPVQIKSDAEYDALPSGAQFIAPDGSVRKKP